ncbi:MAG: C25 family cysteine peptidase [Lentimicrobiaceae bacterium]|nr:C25 family cysteine peptidase [Lentimicrobiaceae bacterium]
MKKNLCFIIMIMLLTSVAWSQNWVPLTKTVPAEPEISIIQSNNREVSFTVELSGFFSTPITEAGVNYQRLSIPACGVSGSTGEPEIPVISKRIAVPVCNQVNYSVKVIKTQTFSSYRVYPVPELQLDNTDMLQEVFTINPSVYLQNDFMPTESYTLGETGALRHQHYVELEIHPMQFNPVIGQLLVATEMEVILTFNKPITDANVPTGIFNKVAASSFINYEDNGMSALVNDKAYKKTGFTPGNVHWIDLTDTAQSCTIVADYLIITIPDFFTPNNPNSQLKRLADHRAYYNGFDVAIVNVEQILGLNFYYEGPSNTWEPSDKYIKEQRIRTFIRRVFEGKNAHHSHNPYGDGHLAYVLLVGDNYGENGEGMPTGKEHGISNGYVPDDVYPSDYYFTCITKDATGKYDHVGDLFIGRFSVEDTIQLFNMVQKTIFHETDFNDNSWRKSAGSTVRLNLIQYLPEYHSFMSNLLGSCGWSYTGVTGAYDHSGIKIPTLNYLNDGVCFVQYVDFPSYMIDPDSWLDGLNISCFLNELSNDHKAPFISAVCSRTAHFDNMECLGEFLTRYDPSKGAVGYIGNTRLVEIVVTSESYHQILPSSLFSGNISIAGELLLDTKLQHGNGGIGLKIRYAYNLLGDPALNILAELDTVCRRNVANTLTIPNVESNTYTIYSDCPLHFLQNGKLIIEEGGTLIIEEGAQIYGDLCQQETVIHIKNGAFTVGNNVTFNNLNGIYIENKKKPLYDETKLYSINNATFNNTPLAHRGTNLNISNCTFNAGSHLKTSISQSIIDNCIFNASQFISDHTLVPTLGTSMLPITVITNCNFEGSNSNYAALQFLRSTSYEIANSIISGYVTGISLEQSGTTQTIGGIVPAVITNNNVSNCNIGIELFNSVAQFSSNHIHNNNHGVRLHNNSYTTFGSTLAPSSPPQIIKDCDNIELYASVNSFPTLFRYNQIWDDDNLGNSFDDPLVYWDLDATGKFPSSMLRDVKLNCWGYNFDPLEDLYPSKYYVYDPIWQCGKSSSTTLDAPETLYLSALTYFAEEDYPNAELTFKELIATYPNSQFAIAALHELFAIQQLTNHDYYTLHDYYTTITPSDSNLFEVADFLATRCYVKEKFWQPAVDWYEYRIENPPTYQDSVFAVIDLGDIHLMMEADTVSGTKSGGSCHYRFPFIKPKSKQAYEENKTTLLATLPQIKKTQTEKPLIPQSGKRGSLGQNIPNPATGTTSIGYEIYTAGAVEINLYNAFGQLVKNLPIGMVQAGSHKTTVSLTDLAPGIYHYTLSVNGERTDAKKMVVK